MYLPMGFHIGILEIIFLKLFYHFTFCPSNQHRTLTLASDAIGTSRLSLVHESLLSCQ